MYIAIDVGATNTRILATKDLDNPDFSNIKIFKTEKIYKLGIQKIIKGITKLIKTPKAISISICGRVKEDEQIMTSSTNLPDWKLKPLVSNLKQEFLCPIYLRNDAVMGTLGEASQLKQKNDFIYLTWGTGLGGAIIEYDNNLVNVRRPKNRSLLHEIESLVGGIKCEKKYKKLMKNLSEKEWEEVINNFSIGIKKLSQSKDWNKNIFVIGGGITEKQKNRLILS